MFVEATVASVPSSAKSTVTRSGEIALISSCAIRRGSSRAATIDDNAPV
jgi:hypothetical protein